MTKRDQHMIVTEILDGLRETILERIDRVPKEWDGIELRQWIADTAYDNFAYAPGKWGRKRLKDYRNTRLVENL